MVTYATTPTDLRLFNFFWYYNSLEMHFQQSRAFWIQPFQAQANLNSMFNLWVCPSVGVAVKGAGGCF